MSSFGIPSNLSNLQVRILSSIVLGILVLGITWLGGLSFRLLAGAIGAAIFYEWSMMTQARSGLRHHVVAGVLLAAVLIALVAGYSAGPVLTLLVVSVLACETYGRLSGSGGFWAPAGLLYAGLSAISLAFLRGGDAAGLVSILFLFAVVWATDILAYFVGRRFGGPKLAPGISPGKTQSGAIGGAVGGVVAGLVVALVAGTGNVGTLVVVALILSVVSQAGDLFESWVKRRHGVKDSGRIIPGHGGVMDRVDGLVAAAFALYAIASLSAGANNPAQGLFAS